MNYKIQWLKILVLTLILLLPLASCNGFRPQKIWPISITLIADKHINNNDLLPVDIIVVKASDTILEIGPENWFGDPKRDTLLEGEIYKLAIGNSQKRCIKIKVNPDIEKLIIFSDYTDLTDREGQQIVIDPEKWQLHYYIHLRDRKMELAK